MTRYLDETVVERQIVPERVLPSASILPIVREPIGDELVDLGERQHLIPRRPDRHRCQRDVRIWRLLVAVSVPRRSRHFPNRSPSVSHLDLFRTSLAHRESRQLFSSSVPSFFSSFSSTSSSSFFSLLSLFSVTSFTLFGVDTLSTTASSGCVFFS